MFTRSSTRETVWLLRQLLPLWAPAICVAEEALFPFEVELPKIHGGDHRDAFGHASAPFVPVAALALS
jgi:hypothetical protein